MATKANAPKWHLDNIDPKTAEFVLKDIELTPSEIAAAQTYAADMRAGNWSLNGEAIIFDTAGRLIDGRSRLHAAILAESSFPTVVIEGIHPDAEITIDTHRKRQTRDMLYITGEDKALPLAATVNMVYRLYSGVNRDSVKVVPFDDVALFLEMHPNIRDVIDTVNSLPYRTYVPSLVAAAMFLTEQSDPGKSKAFFDAVSHPERYDTKHPGRILRDKIDKLDKSVSPVLRKIYMHTYVVKAWNAFHAGARISDLQHQKSEKTPLVRGLETSSFNLPSAQRATKENQARSNDIHDSKIAVEVKTLWPADAEELLSRNGPQLAESERNRKISQNAVALYVKDMKRGAWKLNGQSIKISASGRLIDGQHRATACVQSGVPLETIIVRGLPDAVFSSFDKHSKRKFSNGLTRKGIVNSGAFQGALAIIWRYDRFGLKSYSKPTETDLLEAFNEYGDALGESVSYASRSSFKKKLNPSPMAAAHFILTRHDPLNSVDFFARLHSGENLSAGDPILALRRRMEAISENGRMSLRDYEKVDLILAAWGHYVSGTKIATLRPNQNFDAYRVKQRPSEPRLHAA